MEPVSVVRWVPWSAARWVPPLGLATPCRCGSACRALAARVVACGGVDCWVFFGQCLFCVSGCLLQVQEIAFDLVGSAIP